MQAARAGNGPVVLIDTDPQGSLSEWWNARADEAPAFAQTSIQCLARDLAQLREQGFKLAVIDTPPSVTYAIKAVIQLSDLVVIPTRPSPHDLRAAGATVEICEDSGKRFVFVVNAAVPRSRLASEAAIALSQHGPVAPVSLHHRTDYAASMIDGRTVMECVPGGKSTKEVEALWQYVDDRLQRNFRRTVFSSGHAKGAIFTGAGGQRTMGRKAVNE